MVLRSDSHPSEQKRIALIFLVSGYYKRNSRKYHKSYLKFKATETKVRPLVMKRKKKENAKSRKWEAEIGLISISFESQTGTWKQICRCEITHIAVAQSIIC